MCSAMDTRSCQVAHRLSSIRDADEIFVFEGGRVVERGSHVTLVAAGGSYSKLLAAQAGWKSITHRFQLRPHIVRRRLIQPPQQFIDVNRGFETGDHLAHFGMRCREKLFAIPVSSSCIFHQVEDRCRRSGCICRAARKPDQLTSQLHNQDRRPISSTKSDCGWPIRPACSTSCAASGMDMK